MIARTVKVSDHALLRYLERVRGIDVEAARAEVEEITGVAASLGARNTALNGHIYIIDGYTVTTVLPKDGRPRSNDYRRGTRGRYAVKAAAAS